MSSPLNVVLVGPLAVLREQLTNEFLRSGYAPSTVARHLQLLAHVSSWMLERGIATSNLSWEDIGTFCLERDLPCVHRYAPPPVMVLMRMVRPDLIPTRPTRPGTIVPAAAEELLSCFGQYLHDERALAPSTLGLYMYQVRVFALWFVARFDSDLSRIGIANVDEFYVSRTVSWSTSAVRSSVVALRAFVRWLFLTGRSTSNLSAAILTVKDTSQNALPKALPPAELTKLLAVTMTVRDRAILLLLTQLGLRANEVSGLRIDDFDWRVGTVLIRGKGNDSQLMPVPAEVGEAIAQYLSESTGVRSSYREVFLGVYAPYLPVGRCAITMLVTNLAKRAGIVGRVSSHRLRHTAATAVLAGGGTLAEAGQLLRHRSPQSTMIYARTDLVALAQLARPWPGRSGEDNAHE
jgi:integrase/recombinase XerD